MSWLGSGSHTPFSIHVAELGPMSTIPAGQLKLTVLPSTCKTILLGQIYY